MRSAILSIAIFAFGAYAQSVADLPACSLTCFASTPSGNGCQLTDVPCLCADTAFQTAVAACIQTACTDPADLQTAVTVGQALCGGSIDTSSIAEAGSSSAAESMSSMDMSSTMMESEDSASSTMMMSSMSTMMSSMMPTGSSTANAAGASTVPDSGANANTVSKLMGAAAAVGAIFLV